MITHLPGLELVPWWLRAGAAVGGALLGRFLVLASLNTPMPAYESPPLMSVPEAPPVRFVPRHVPPPPFIREAYALKPTDWNSGDCRQRCYRDVNK